MNDRNIGDLIWGFIYGVIIGWVLLGTFKVLWWALRMLGRLCMWVINRARGKTQAKLIVSFDQGESLRSEGYLDEAEETYRKLANSRDSETRAHALCDLGLVLEQKCQWDEALSAYEEAVAQREPEVSPIAMLGVADVLYLGKHNRTRAATAYRELLAPGRLGFAERADRESLVQMASRNLASLLYEEGELQEAEILCRRSIEIDADRGGHDLGLVVGLARVMARQGRVDDALKLLRATVPTKHAIVASDRGCPLFRANSLVEVAAEIGAYQNTG